MAVNRRLLGLEVLLGGTVVASAVPWVGLGTPSLLAGPVGFLLMATLFLVLEDLDIKLDLGASTHALTLAELPFALGVLWVDPRALVASRLVASVVHGTLVRRQPRVKLVFNVLQHAATLALAVTLVRETVSVHSTGPAAFLALVGGAWVLSLASLAAVFLAIRVTGGDFALSSLTRVAVSDLLGATVCAHIGFFTVLVVRASTWTIVPATGLTICAGVGYASYVRLQDKHKRLLTLKEFMRGLDATRARGDEVTTLLSRLCDLFNAEQAALLVLGPEGHWTEHIYDEDGLRSSSIQHAHDWVLVRTIASRSALLLPRGSRDPAVRTWLAARGVLDAIVSPFPEETGLQGVVVVAGRRSTHGSFEREDLRVLEGVARHTAVTFQAAGLVQRLVHESRHDALTGLPNRTAFRTSVDEELERGTTASVLLMDLDHFKDVNDTLGHQAGDLLLQEVARRLSAALPREAVLARLGGDEFAVLLPGASAAEARDLAVEVRESLTAPMVVDWLTTRVGVSIGVATGPEHGGSCAQLQRRADVAMYAAKAGTGVRVWSAELEDRGIDRLALLADLRTAVAEESLEVHFQPKTAGDGQVVGFEGLLRWAHPTRGWIGPDVFVPLAVTSELLPAITDFALDRSLAAARAAQDAGHACGVAVNLSVRDLLETSLPGRVSAALGRHGIAPEDLTLEITEHSLMEKRAECLVVLHRLRALGVRLSIDDFGTGHSSLTYLRELPVQEVKLDRRFIRNLTSSGTDQTIVSAVVAMVRCLQLCVVAEGVEDAAAWALLQGMGCDEIQGWYVAPALPLPELLAWLEQRKLRNSIPRQDVGASVVPISGMVRTAGS